AARWAGLFALGRVLAGRLRGFVGLFVGSPLDDLAFLEARTTRLLDADGLRKRVVADAEAELVENFAREELAVAGVLDLHLAQHLREDDFDVLVVDLHALASVDVLDLGQQILMERLLAFDAE